ncbi:hypothetical protein R1sor_000506 [Riccia sorocarpa]|uniref:Uncharacterized protein n=1 Tax=Riccia sorocarpa TaxID=122646 RepID=A0ABD3GVT5_9MARC
MWLWRLLAHRSPPTLTLSVCHSQQNEHIPPDVLPPFLSRAVVLSLKKTTNRPEIEFTTTAGPQCRSFQQETTEDEFTAIDSTTLFSAFSFSCSPLSSTSHGGTSPRFMQLSQTRPGPIYFDERQLHEELRRMLAAQAKVRDYADRDPSDDFIPLALETYGCLHPRFDAFIVQCAHDMLSRSSHIPLPPSLLITSYRQRIAVALQRSHALAILQRATAVTAASSSLPPLSSTPSVPLVDMF